AVLAGEPDAMAAITGALAQLNGRPGDGASFDALHALLEAQAFRLAYWRVAADDINYRRFFDINELAALRAEEPEVFEASHRLLLRLLAEGKVDALRIDHPDGLYDPKAYFERLQAAVRSALSARAAAAPRRRRSAPPAASVYTVVEKILADDETLPPDWPVQGTTGYRFANMVNGLWVDAGARARIDRVYSAYLGRRLDFRDILLQSKLLVMTEALASDLNLLAHALARIAEADRNTRDLTFNGLRRALLRYTAALPVYRTYVDDRGAGAADRRYIESAIGVLRTQHVGADISTLDFLHRVLAGSLAPAGSPQQRDALRFARRLQQFTAPVMAKAMEDTSFYIYNRLASLNEVGGDPRQFGVSVAAFHAAARQRQRQWPAEMLATSTHDNKRSEDVRARIDVLSELPALWRLALRRWTRLAARYETTVREVRLPDRNDQYLFYQTLLGVWPSGALDSERLDAVRARLNAYMRKAAREAKVHTSWVNPSSTYETALASFIDGLLGRLEPNPFLQDFAPLSAVVARCGLYNSLAQTLLKLTAPGVPDIYQGNELWDFSLVDPDNRRAVDYARRRAVLRELRAACGEDGGNAALARALFESIDDGRLKMYVIWRALELRARRPRLFEQGRYVALPVAGAHAAHIVAFARVHDDQALLAIVPRLLFGLTAGATRPPIGQIWEDTRVLLPSPLAAYRDVLTGALRRPAGNGAFSLVVADIFDTLPAALLETIALPLRYAGGSRRQSAM
ncbi:MAG TPA: malto-oligosyltrehalose synthase, partial [Casimicrobiaceae bacterium]|nr:malto-oligosyltrehalose synthase [Casimicrobiaceae bacterium]